MDILIKVPHEICSTGVPSYKCARIPIMSGLNVAKWQSYLSGCPDDRLINYIKFGFPLSLSNRDLLCNQSIKNHTSCLQFSDAVKQCIYKERVTWPF